MKYGNIICDPTSEEAKKLVGKKVIASNVFTDIMEPKESVKSTLLEIVDGDIYPFKMGESNPFYEYTFIREVIEEAPKYRPYKNTTEMIEDFKKRFNVTCPPHSIPLIWLKKDVSEEIALVTLVSNSYVEFGSDTFYYMHELFNMATYLDGSPVGKEIDE